MKHKEIKNLAKKIVQQELILQNSADTTERTRAEQEIIKLTSGIESFEDMIAIDELVYDLLKKNS